MRTWAGDRGWGGEQTGRTEEQKEPSSIRFMGKGAMECENLKNADCQSHTTTSDDRPIRIGHGKGP